MCLGCTISITPHVNVGHCLYLAQCKYQQTNMSIVWGVRQAYCTTLILVCRHLPSTTTFGTSIAEIRSLGKSHNKLYMATQQIYDNDGWLLHILSPGGISTSESVFFSLAMSDSGTIQSPYPRY